MTDPEISPTTSSHRTILRSSAVIGGSTLVNIVFGIARTKAAALILGPSGVGMIGVFQTLVQTASNVAALGIGTSAAREIARAEDDLVRLATVRGTLFKGSLVLAILGGLATFLLREPLAIWMVGDATEASTIGWLSLGVALTVMGGAQIAYLIGRRRMRDVALVNILTGAGGALLAVIALMLFGASAVIFFVLAPMMVSWFAGWWFVRRGSATRGLLPVDPHDKLLFRAMLVNGLPLVVASVATLVSQLLVRVMIQRALGLEAVGLFQASFLISVIYVGFVLQAMGADYFPRLSAAAHDRQLANRLISEQSEVALLLAAPVLLFTLGSVNWLIPLLYSSRFGDAAWVLSWQIAADIFKVASWPLGYALLARGASRTYMVAELGASAVLLLALYLLLPTHGIEASGIAVLCSYAFYLPLVLLLARRASGFRWSPTIWRSFVALVAAAGGLMVLARFSPIASLVAGTCAAIVAAWYAVRYLRSVMPDLDHRLSRVWAWKARR